MVSKHQYVLGSNNGGRFVLTFTIAEINIMTFVTPIDVDDVFTPANFGGDRSMHGGVMEAIFFQFS